jgi:hypothetical protein
MRSEELKWVLWVPRKAREAKRESDERDPIFWKGRKPFLKVFGIKEHSETQMTQMPLRQKKVNKEQK